MSSPSPRPASRATATRWACSRRVAVHKLGEDVAELRVSGDTWAWYSVTGTLRCGLGAQDPATLQVRGKSNGVGVSLLWRYVVVAFNPL